MNQLFGSIMRGIYDMVGNYGLAIVVFTLLSKLILLPLSIKQTKTTKLTSMLQPKIQELQKKYAHDQQKQSEELMKLYQKYNFNPMSSCLPLLIQFPIIIGLFNVLRQPTEYVFTPEEYAAINRAFLWIEDLSASAIEVIKANGVSIVSALALILPLVNFFAMILTQKQTSAQTDMSQAGSMGAFMKFMPYLIGYSALSFAQGLSLYWALSTLLSMAITAVLNNFLNVEVVEEVKTPAKKSATNSSGRKYSTDGSKKGGNR
ncbi:MAG: YidC/Oxa1 family membrane protein insertase [Anaerofustis stercorihominis]|nr:YidC/Oxa1 family membrane protein insertase [Anaerofustis stercorihominis]